MPEQIFDQDRPRSAMARRLDEAFAGCEEWTIAPPAPRRDTLDVAPWLSSADAALDRSEADTRLPRAA
jgi:hypothetical protein